MRARRSSKSEDGPCPDRAHNVRENIVSHALSHQDIACVISDIVKRRSIRVGSRRDSVRILHYLQIISALAPLAG